MLFLYSIALVDIALCQWTPAGSSGVVCIHTALLPNSQVLCLERPHKDQYPINSLTGGLLSAQIDVMNTANADGSWTSKFTPIAIENNPFCGGHCQMADGSVMVIGGDNQSMVGPDNVEYVRNGRNGRRQFTPQGTAVGKWSLLPDMTSARWYPTVLTLQSGTVMIIGGNTRNLDFDFLTVEENNPTIEYWPAKPSGPFESPLLRWAFPHMMYPIAFQAPSGKVMLFVSNRTDIIDPTTDTSTQLPDLPSMDHAPWIYPHTPTGTILPMTIKNNFAFTVRVCGGNKLSSKDASPMCIEVSPDAPNAAWKVVGDMPHARLMPDSVLLPDGKILYVNGLGYGQAGGNAGQCQYAQRPELATDMYDPETGKWSTLQNAVQRRLYHSGAILLESGHVLTMGSEMDNYDECWPIPKNSCMPFTDLACSSPFNTKLERFAPPYLSQVNDQRIVIKNATASVTHESAFQLDLVDTKNVVRVTFLRYSTTTHSTNTDQRFVELVIVGKTSTSIYVTAPKLMHAPPGNWMVFVLDKDGVPSIAKTVSLQIGAISSIPVPKEAKKNNAVKGAGILGLFGALVMMF